MKSFEFITESSSRFSPQLYAPNPEQNINEQFGPKPSVKVWTSTAIKTPEGITSEWVRWCDSEMPEWVGDFGFLFDVNPSAKILTIRSDADAIKIAQHYKIIFKNINELMTNMPWSAISKDYDAVHYTAENAWEDRIMRVWDVESTAWFNPSMLTNKKQVKLAKEDLWGDD